MLGIIRILFLIIALLVAAPGFAGASQSGPPHPKLGIGTSFGVGFVLHQAKGSQPAFVLQLPPLEASFCLHDPWVLELGLPLLHTIAVATIAGALGLGPWFDLGIDLAMVRRRDVGPRTTLVVGPRLFLRTTFARGVQALEVRAGARIGPEFRGEGLESAVAVHFEPFVGMVLGPTLGWQVGGQVVIRFRAYTWPDKPKRVGSIQQEEAP